MDADTYQNLAGRTLIDRPDFELKREHAAHAQELLDFAASVGAIAEYIKKGIFHQHGFSDGELYRLYKHAMRNDDTRGVPWMDDAMVMMVWNAIGLIGEAGEVARLVLDAIHSHQPIDTLALQKELGDVSWYHAAIATRAGLSLRLIQEHNIAKLQQRYPAYTPADSVARVDVAEPADDVSLVGWGSVRFIDNTEPDAVPAIRVDPYVTICNQCGLRKCQTRTCVDPCDLCCHCPAPLQQQPAEDDAVLKTSLGGLLAEIATTFFDGVPVLPIQPEAQEVYMANLTFDGKVLLDTKDNQDASLDRADRSARVAELCGACLEYKDQATMTPCPCGADICAECAANGVTRCFICSDGGSIC